MEYVQGSTSTISRKSGRLPYDVAAIIAMQVARPDYVHYRRCSSRHQACERDAVACGRVKVMDFGSRATRASVI
jgi:hypothetical protein